MHTLTTARPIAQTLACVLVCSVHSVLYQQYKQQMTLYEGPLCAVCAKDFYFDTTAGHKRQASSYEEILLTLGVIDPSKVLFVTDVYEEAVAAGVGVDLLRARVVRHDAGRGIALVCAAR